MYYTVTMNTQHKLQRQHIRRNQILDGLLELLSEKDNGPLSVADLAAKLGIAKGGLYHYFDSIDQAFMQLVEREYGAAINEVELALHSATNASVVEQIAILTTTYIQTAPTNRALDSYLHLDAYAHIHQRSLAYITERLAAILGEIIQRGVTDGIFICVNPQATATVILGMVAFIGDKHIFPADHELHSAYLEETVRLMALGLGLEADTFADIAKQLT